MWGEQVAAVIGALVSLVWAGLALYVLYLLRETMPAAIGRLSGFEAYGLKLSLSASNAMAAAIEMARKHERWAVEVPPADRDAALNRARKESALLERAEILWVDDHPSNNRYEARMLRSFGAIITFASTTEDALETLAEAGRRHQPFHLILSDVSRDFPAPDPQGGLRMLERLKAEGIVLPVVLYVGRIEPGSGVPAGAFALCNRPDHLLLYVLDALARTRGG